MLQDIGTGTSSRADCQNRYLEVYGSGEDSMTGQGQCWLAVRLARRHAL